MRGARGSTRGPRSGWRGVTGAVCDGRVEVGPPFPPVGLASLLLAYPCERGDCLQNAPPPQGHNCQESPPARRCPAIKTAVTPLCPGAAGLTRAARRARGRLTAAAHPAALRPY